MFLRGLAVLFTLISVLPATGQDFSPTPLIPLPSIAEFPLTEAILAKMEKIQEDLLQLPDDNGSNENDHITSIQDLAAVLEKRPELMAVLSNYKISARDYVTAYMALAAALAAASAEGEEQIFDETRTISKENLAFGKKYANRIRRLLDG